VLDTPTQRETVYKSLSLSLSLSLAWFCCPFRNEVHLERPKLMNEGSVYGRITSSLAPSLSSHCNRHLFCSCQWLSLSCKRLLVLIPWQKPFFLRFRSFLATFCYFNLSLHSQKLIRSSESIGFSFETTHYLSFIARDFYNTVCHDSRLLCSDF
jgi:hypothetical protein